MNHALPARMTPVGRSNPEFSGSYLAIISNFRGANIVFIFILLRFSYKK